MLRLLLPVVAVGIAAGDKYGDYNKFPNSRADNYNAHYGGSSYSESPYSTGGYGSTYGSGIRGGGSYDSAGGTYENGAYGTSGTYGRGIYGTAGTYGSDAYGSGTYGSGTYGSGTYGSASYGGGTYGTGTFGSGYGGAGYCSNRTGQFDIQMEHIMGMWYGVEYIPHLVANPGTYWGDTCIVLHIAETTFDTMMTPSPYYHQTFIQSTYFREHRRLRLVWDEAGNDVEYTLYFRNSSVGYWDSHGDQIGSLASSNNYKQFTGTVQVLKAVRNHLLLHFCQAPRDGNPAQLFSILLSREPRTLNSWDISASHELLQRKGLSVTTRRLVCGNSGGSQIAVSMLTVAVAVLIFISHGTY